VSSQASCTPPSTNAAAEDSLLSIFAFSSIPSPPPSRGTRPRTLISSCQENPCTPPVLLVKFVRAANVSQ
jgi:hypothetical protein